MGKVMWIAVFIILFVWLWKQSTAYNYLPGTAHQSFTGPTASQFGFSVALWKDKNDVKRVVVGAPKGNRTGWRTQHLALGVVYLCVLQPRGQNTCGGGEGAYQTDILPKIRPNELDIILDDYNHTIRYYGMGVGQTIVSEKNEGARLVICAPRFPVAYSRDFVGTNGICVTIDDPNKSIAVIAKGNAPLYKNSLTGFSVAIGKKLLFMGSPKPYANCGFITSCNNTWGSCTTRSTSNDVSGNSKTCTDDHRGWAVKTGKFGGADSDLQVATSSPKSDYNFGRISFFTKELEELPDIIIKGKEANALFGYSLAAVDVNGDGGTDLLVGSPLATDETSNHFDAGKVFVYLSPLAQDDPPDPNMTLVGKVPFGRFGATLASLGDIDLDGYEDVAVGAPYGGVDGSGVVYVYIGGSDGLQSNKPQIITPSPYLPGARGFGFSIDGGLDMDGNNYPDMVIGAMDSDTAVLLRASPVLRLEGAVHFASSNISIMENICVHELAGQIKLRGICLKLYCDFTYSTNATYEELYLNYNLTIKSNKEKAKIAFKTTDSKRHDRAMKIYKDKSSRWGSTVFVQRARSNLDLGITASVTVSLNSYEPQGLVPILDPTGSTFTTATKLVCMADSCETQPDLALTAYGVPVTLGEHPMLVQVNVTLKVMNDTAYGVTMKVKYQEELKYQSVGGTGIVPKCHGTYITDTEVTCTFGEVDGDAQIDFWLIFTYGIDQLEKLIPGVKISLSVRNDVDTDRNLANNKAEVLVKMKTVASLYTEGFSDPEMVLATVNKSLTAEDLTKLKQGTATPVSVDKLGPHFTHVFSLNNRGPSPVKEAKMMLYVPLYLHGALLTYMMSQPTPSPGVTCTSLEINTLNLMEPHIVTKATTKPSSQHREKREVKQSFSTTASSADTSSSTFPTNFEWTTDAAEYFSTTYDPLQGRSDEDNYYYLECKEPQCLITCEVAMIPAGQSVNITLSSYLVIATIHKLNLDKVAVRTWVKTDVPNATVVNHELFVETKIELTGFMEQGFSAIPWWIWAASVAAALLFIIIIMIILSKYGFFKRKRAPTGTNRQSIMQQTRNSAIQNNQPPTDAIL